MKVNATVLKIKAKETATLLKASFREWWSKEPFRESAVIAYYAIFSLPGLLVLVISLAGYFFGRDAVNDHLAAEITKTFGAETATQIKNMTAIATDTGSSVWASIIGVVTIIVGAMGVFDQFQKTLNTIWGVKASTAKAGLRELVKVRLFSFGLILSVAFILIISLVVSTILSAFGTWLSVSFSDSTLVILQVINFMVSLLIISLLFALIFKFLPDAKIKWRHVWVGSLLTALLFEIGKINLGLYFGKAHPGSNYGAAGSVILIMLWASYSSMIVFYGAEFTKAYAQKKEGNIPAEEHAVKIKHLKKA